MALLRNQSCPKYAGSAGSGVTSKHSPTNTYDDLNRLETTTDAEGITVTNEYDAAGNKTAVIDGKTQRTEFTYDGLNRNTSIKDPAGRSVTFTYDGVNKIARLDSKGQTTSYLYDDRHRLTTVDYDSSNTAVNSDRLYTYDDVGNLLSVTESGKGTKANVAYTYDALNRQITETSGGFTHTYEYDLAGNRTSVTYGGTGRVIESTYDALNRLETLTDDSAITTYGYDLNGNIVSLALPNGDTTEKTFDALNRATTIETLRSNIPFLTYENTFDLVGNVVEISETYGGASSLDNRVINNEYDDIYRLTKETITPAVGSPVVTEYGYDNAHNRASKTVGSTVSTYTYTHNNLNQLTSFSDGTTTTAYTYDHNGNRITRTRGTETDTYGYDFENRLVSLLKETAVGTGEYQYVYDYRTRRVERTEEPTSGPSVTTKLVFSGGTSVQERVGSNVSVEYIRGSDYGGGIGGILYTSRGGEPSFTHYNNRGDVVAKTNALGALTYEAQYEAYGTRTAEEGSTQDRQKANTKDEDPTGLLNEGFRYRDLETGAFITRDPLGFVDGPNMYAYVVQNPWTMFDPEGLEAAFIIHRDGDHNSPGTMYSYEDGVYVGSERVNENGYQGPEQGLKKQTEGIPASPSGKKYIVLPKNNEDPGDKYPNGQPSITAPQYADPKSKNYAPGMAAEGWNPTVRIHEKSTNGTPDSQGCITVSSKSMVGITATMLEHLDRGGTNVRVYAGPPTHIAVKDEKGQPKKVEVRRGEPVIRMQPSGKEDGTNSKKVKSRLKSAGKRHKEN